MKTRDRIARILRDAVTLMQCGYWQKSSASTQAAEDVRFLLKRLDKERKASK